MRVDTSKLSSGDQQALVKLVEAARIMDDIFLKQYWSGNRALYAKLQKDTTPLGKARLHYFWINKGPWSALDDFKAVSPGRSAAQAAGRKLLSRRHDQAGVRDLGCDSAERGPGTGQRIFHGDPLEDDPLKSARQLMIVPYSEEYKDDLARAAELLQDAAGLTDNAYAEEVSQPAGRGVSLQRLLRERPGVDGSGRAPRHHHRPLRDLQRRNFRLQGGVRGVRQPPRRRGEREALRLHPASAGDREQPAHRSAVSQSEAGRGSADPRSERDLCAGDGKRGVQTAAYNLPNDERVVQQKGSKRVMLKNVQEAKFRSVLLPIARRMLLPKRRVDVNFESFFTHIVAHELMHGLGPHQITVDGRDTTPRGELKELYSAIEEAKADVTGLFALQYMMDHAREMKLARCCRPMRRRSGSLYTTYLASMFRSLRFGLNDAHGKGMAVQFNYLMDKGAFAQQADGTFAVDMEKIKQAVRDLDHDLLTLEAEGDYAGPKKMLDDLGVIRPGMKKAFDRLEEIPTDIEPIFVTADELAPEKPQPSAKPVRRKKSR